MFLHRDVKDQVGEVAETAAKDPATTTHLNVVKNSWQTKLVRLRAHHVASLDHQAKLLRPASWVSLLYDVTVCADDYHWRVGRTSLHTDTK